MRLVLISLLFLTSFAVHAEGRCPPGQYPVGDQNAGGCAPIPGATQPSNSAPAGEWETRWGAIVEDPQNLSTGASVSKRTRREAISAATDECRRVGGNKCQLRIAYYNQCVAIADPAADSRGRVGGESIAYSAVSVQAAKSGALKRCESAGGGQRCTLVYSACSESEFKKF